MNIKEIIRHCEERRDEAISSGAYKNLRDCHTRRLARNDSHCVVAIKREAIK